MIPVLTDDQAYQLDKNTIESGCLTELELMDNAGKAVAQFFCEKILNPFNQRVVIVCGKGNNGCDGVVAHSYLKKYNVQSKIIFIENKYIHVNLLKRYNIPKSDYSVYNEKNKFHEYDWIIDGIFGIGLNRDLDDRYTNLINSINRIKNVISIDVPSGSSSNEINNESVSIYPKYTITFGYSKLTHYMNACNNVITVNIGFKSFNDSRVLRITLKDIKNIIKNRIHKENKHKNSTECVIIAGSYEYPGAAILSSKAAHKTGSGYVNLYYKNLEKKSLLENIKTFLPDIIVKSLHEIKNKHASYCKPTLIGPGGTMISDLNYFNSAFNLSGKFIIDAEAISSFCNVKGNRDLIEDIKKIPEYSILTPHVGEFKKFFNLNKINYVSMRKIQKIIDGRIIILKTFNTFIITKEMIYIVDKGPSILATAGTGDVLSGILVSLIAQGYSRIEASFLGTYLHAEAANYYNNNISKDSMTASDLIECIPYAFNKLRKSYVN